MANYNDKQIKLLGKSVKYHLDKATKDMSMDMQYKLESMFTSAIDYFYNEYEPLIYNRTGWSRKAYKSTYNKTKNGYECGVSIGATYINGHPYNDSNEYVFDRVYNKGIHGTFNIQGIQRAKFFNIGGKRMFKKYRHQYRSNINKVKMEFGDMYHGEYIAKGKHYSPRAIVNKFWATYSKQYYLRELAEGYLLNELNALESYWR